MSPAPPGFTPTPSELVDDLLARCLAQLPPGSPPPRCLDPACGDGAFLLGFARALAKRLPSATPGERERLVRAHVHGVELDPGLARRARARLAAWILPRGDGAELERLAGELDTVRNGCALSAPLPGEPWGEPLSGAPAPPLDWRAAFPDQVAGPEPGFELVAGNPPYLDSEWLCEHHPGWRDALRQRFRTARGNWDLYCPFVERALALTRVGGVQAFVVPNTLAAAGYAQTTRALLSREAQLCALGDLSRQRPFRRGVYPLTYVVRKRPPPAAPAPVELHGAAEGSLPYALFQGSTWPLGTGLRARALGLLELGQDLPRLDDPALAQVHGAATVAEAYALADCVRDDPCAPPGALRLVNSGTIDPYRDLWGARRLRYLGRSYLHPVVADDDLRRVAPRRADQARRPKLVVAGNTRRLEAVADPRGELLAGKSTTVIRPRGDVSPSYLAGVLNARVTSFLYRLRFESLALAGGYLRVGPPQLRALPVPPPSRDPRRASRVEALARELARSPQDAHAQAELDALVAALYGVSPELDLGA